MRGGARWQPARRTFRTLSRLSRAPYLRRWALILALASLDRGRARAVASMRAMPFAYFQRLTRRQQAIYLKSDAVPEMPLARPETLRPLVGELARLGAEVGPRGATEAPALWAERAAAARPHRPLGRAVDEIADPAGEPIDFYRRTAAELDDRLTEIAALLAGVPTLA